MNWKISLMVAVMIVAGMTVAGWPQMGADEQKPTATVTPDNQTLINIHAKHATAEEVFMDLSEQSGVQFTAGMGWDARALKLPKDVDITNQPFWAALRQLGELWDASFDVMPRVGMGQIMITVPVNPAAQPPPAKKTPGPVFSKGGVDIEVRQFDMDLTVPYYSPTAAGEDDFTGLALKIYLDPSLGKVDPAFKLEKAVDDAGNSMLSDEKAAPRGFRPRQSLQFAANLPLKYPRNPGKKIAEVKGTLELKTVEKTEAVTIDNPLAAAEKAKTVGDLTFIFHSFKRGDPVDGFDMYVLDVTIKRDGAMIDADETWYILQSAKLTDAQQRPFAGGGGQAGKDDYQLNFMGGRRGGRVPTRLVVELPAQTHVVKVPFEFKDLSLP